MSKCFSTPINSRPTFWHFLKRPRPTTFGWVRRTPDAVRVGPNGALGINVDAAKHAGDNSPATISAISLTGRVGPPLVTVVGLATHSDGSDLFEVPSLIWRTPVWDVLSDGRIAYVPFGRELRIEVYDPAGEPSLLITGRLPFRVEPVTPKLVRQLVDAFFQRIYDEPIDSAAQRCDSLRRLPNWSATVRCQTVDYAKTQGKRLPSTFPPITDVVHLAEGGFAVRTSHVDNGLTSWLLVGANGNSSGQLTLANSQQIIGGTMRHVAVADTADGHMTISWNTVER